MYGIKWETQTESAGIFFLHFHFFSNVSFSSERLILCFQSKHARARTHTYWCVRSIQSNNHLTTWHTTHVQRNRLWFFLSSSNNQMNVWYFFPPFPLLLRPRLRLLLRLLPHLILLLFFVPVVFDSILILFFVYVLHLSFHHKIKRIATVIKTFPFDEIQSLSK